MFAAFTDESTAVLPSLCWRVATSVMITLPPLLQQRLTRLVNWLFTGLYHQQHQTSSISLDSSAGLFFFGNTVWAPCQFSLKYCTAKLLTYRFGHFLFRSIFARYLAYVIVILILIQQLNIVYFARYINTCITPFNVT